MLMWTASQGRPGRESRTHLPWGPLRKVLKIKKICLAGDKIQAQEQGGFLPTCCSPYQEGVGLAREMWGWKPIEHFIILCFSPYLDIVHSHAVITLSHELMC